MACPCEVQHVSDVGVEVWRRGAEVSDDFGNEASGEDNSRATDSSTVLTRWFIHSEYPAHCVCSATSIYNLSSRSK